MSDRYFTAVEVDPELIPGARNAIQICLRVKPSERVTIITDEATQEIAAALENEIEKTGAAYSVFVIEDLAARRWVESKLKANELITATRKALQDCRSEVEADYLNQVERALAS